MSTSKRGNKKQAPYESLLDELDLHVLLVDSTGRIAYANPRAESALAAQHNGLKSLMLDSLFSLRNPQWLAHEVRKSGLEGHWSGEIVLNRLDGTECWCHVQACKSPAALGLSDSALIEFEDITGNVELMSTLMRRNEDLFQRNRELEIVSKVGRLLLANTDLEYRLTATLKEAARTIGVSCGVVWVKSRDGERLVARSAYGFEANLFVNSASTGLNEQSLAGQTVRTGKAHAIEDMAGEHSVLNSFIRQLGVKSALCVPMIANDDVIGALTLGETGARRSFTPDEIMLVEVVANSAASAVANALLAEDVEVSHTHWQRTFDSIGDVILVVDASGRVVRANEALASRLQTNPSALLGEECERLIQGVTPGLIKRVLASASHESLGQQEIAGEQCEVTVYPISHAPGKATAAVVYAKIITSERRLRQEVDHANRLASVGELLAGVAHSFGNVLAETQSSLTAAFGKANSSADPEDIASDFDSAMRHLAAGTEVVHRLLSFSHGGDAEPGRVSLRHITQAAITLCKGHPLTIGRTLTNSVPPEVAAVMAQEGPLQEVVFSLILNALQATEQGGSVSVEAEAYADRGHADLRVVDDGCGMDSDMLERVFEPFYSTRGGSGLGLSTSAAIVHRMDGSISVDSRPGEGTVVTVRLPLAGSNWKARECREAA